MKNSKDITELIKEPPKYYDTNTVVGMNGLFFYCIAQCPRCQKKKIILAEIENCKIKHCFGEWWVENPTGPEGSLSAIPCRLCDEPNGHHPTRKSKSKNPIFLPGLAAVEKFQKQNKLFAASQKRLAPT